jgi:5-methylcytosine-specific restriction endonuclease McrA
MKRVQIELRREVAAREGCEEGTSIETCCAYCGQRGFISWLGQSPDFYVLRKLSGDSFTRDAMHLDHLIPESRNGPTSLDNTVIACAPCNIRKSNRPFGDPAFQVWMRNRRSDLVASGPVGESLRLAATQLTRLEGITREMMVLAKRHLGYSPLRT